MKKLIVLVLSLAASLAHASGSSAIHQSGADLSDQASLQRGAKLYMNYCLGCHSLKYMRYSRMAKDLGLTEDQVMGSLNFTGAKFGEQMTISMRPADATKWVGKEAPDLSLITRVKHGGPDWIYTYLKSFYQDPTRPLGWNNTLFPNVGMPNVLWELQGVQSVVFKKGHGEHGADAPVAHFEQVSPGRLNPEQYNQVARDISNFLQYAAEPAALQRQAVGVWVLGFLAFLTLLTWFLKHEYWRDVH